LRSFPFLFFYQLHCLYQKQKWNWLAFWHRWIFHWTKSIIVWLKQRIIWFVFAFHLCFIIFFNKWCWCNTLLLFFWFFRFSFYFNCHVYILLFNLLWFFHSYFLWLNITRIKYLSQIFRTFLKRIWLWRRNNLNYCLFLWGFNWWNYWKSRLFWWFFFFFCKFFFKS
jgi:hypothetical protein